MAKSQLTKDEERMQEARRILQRLQAHPSVKLISSVSIFGGLGLPPYWLEKFSKQLIRDGVLVRADHGKPFAACVYTLPSSGKVLVDQLLASDEDLASWLWPGRSTLNNLSPLLVEEEEEEEEEEVAAPAEVEPAEKEEYVGLEQHLTMISKAMEVVLLAIDVMEQRTARIEQRLKELDEYTQQVVEGLNKTEKVLYHNMRSLVDRVERINKHTEFLVKELTEPGVNSNEPERVEEAVRSVAEESPSTYRSGTGGG